MIARGYVNIPQFFIICLVWFKEAKFRVQSVVKKQTPLANKKRPNLQMLQLSISSENTRGQLPELVVV